MLLSNPLIGLQLIFNLQNWMWSYREKNVIFIICTPWMAIDHSIKLMNFLWPLLIWILKMIQYENVKRKSDWLRGCYIQLKGTNLNMENQLEVHLSLYLVEFFRQTTTKVWVANKVAMTWWKRKKKQRLFGLPFRAVWEQRLHGYADFQFGDLSLVELESIWADF